MLRNRVYALLSLLILHFHVSRVDEGGRVGHHDNKKINPTLGVKWIF